MQGNNNASNSDTESGEWKVQILMQNNCISVKDFEETRTIYSASKPVEIFIGSDTNDTIVTLFDTLLQRFQQAIETSNIDKTDLPMQVLVYCIIIS